MKLNSMHRLASLHHAYQSAREEVTKDGGRELKEWRAEKRISQKRVAEYCGVSVPYISKIENGAFPVSVWMALKLAKLQEDVERMEREVAA